MPLLDHFHPPLSTQMRWESFHASWAVKLADALTEQWLPADYIAEAFVHMGPRIEIDVATFSRPAAVDVGQARNTTTVAPRTWVPTAAAMVLPSAVPETFEVRVLSTDTGPRLVGVIELVSPGNKDRAEERRAFATKCASYLYQGISLIILDIVTNRRANLHNEIMRIMEQTPSSHLSPDVLLYGVAYRPLHREDRDEIEVWTAPLGVGQGLPVLPLALNVELLIAVDFEQTYVDACRRKRLL
jgi:hypothetical protein